MLSAPTRQGDVIIDIPVWNNTFNKKNENIGIKMSGGADSAIMAYMLAIYCRDENKNGRNLHIFPITSENPPKPYQIIFAKQVISTIEKLTRVKFGTHYTDVLPNWGEYALEQNLILEKLYSRKLVDCHFMGENMNPPMDELNKFKDSGLPPERNEPSITVSPDGLYYRPLRNVNKKSIFDLYTHFGVLDTLFPFTRSCEQLTHQFSKHCGECCFCEERLWGFGRIV
jgi:hypothetical protein